MHKVTGSQGDLQLCSGKMCNVRKFVGGPKTATMIRFLLLILICFWSAYPREVVVHSQAETASVTDSEEYLVYSALIDERHSEPSAKPLFTIKGELVKERHVVDPPLKLVVIEDKTLYTIDSMDAENRARVLREKMPAGVEETFADFISKNQRAYKLSNNFTATIKTELINEQEKQDYFSNKTGMADGFFARYPGAQGTLAFSRVGFNPNKDKALVYVDPREDFDAQLRPLWTWTTYFALLAKLEHGWVIQNVYYPNRAKPDALKQSALTIDLAQCAAASRNLLWGLGSETIEVKGLQRNKCLVRHFMEIEGGYSESQCRIPVSVGELSIYEGGSLFYFSRDVAKYCVVKTGNIFFDQVKSLSEASFECSQPPHEQQAMIREAETDRYTTRRVEFLGNKWVRDTVLRRRITIGLQEGDLFTRHNLVRSLRNVSKVKQIYPVNIRNVELRLNQSEKTVDMTICFKVRQKRGRIR